MILLQRPGDVALAQAIEKERGGASLRCDVFRVVPLPLEGGGRERDTESRRDQNLKLIFAVFIWSSDCFGVHVSAHKCKNSCHHLYTRVHMRVQVYVTSPG